MVKTNCSTLHTVYKIQPSTTEGSNGTTHTLSRRTAAATTRFSPESKGCQKQTAPSYLPTIRSGGPLPRKHSPDGATKARWTHLIIVFLLIYRPRKDERLSWPSWLTCSGRLPTSPVSCRSSVGQWKFAGEIPTFHHCATQPTKRNMLVGQRRAVFSFALISFAPLSQQITPNLERTEHGIGHIRNSTIAF